MSALQPCRLPGGTDSGEGAPSRLVDGQEEGARR